MSDIDMMERKIASMLTTVPPQNRQRIYDQMVGYLVAKVVDGYTAPQAKPTNTNA